MTNDAIETMSFVNKEKQPVKNIQQMEKISFNSTQKVKVGLVITKKFEVTTKASIKVTLGPYQNTNMPEIKS